MCQQGDVDVKIKDHDVGKMALFLAAELEQPQMVDGLLTEGVDVNAKDSIGQTTLFRATRRQHGEIVKLLLAKHASVDSRGDEGRTAWSANVASQSKHILGLLLAAGADPSTRGLQGVSELYTASKDGQTELVKFMLESGTNPSVQTEYDWAPIHWAASYGHVDCVNLLIEAGADVSVKSNQVVTPLDLAIRSGQTDVVGVLKRAGAKEGIDVPETPSSAITIKGHAELEREWIVIGQGLGSMALLDDAPLAVKLFLVFDKPLSRTLAKDTNFGQFVYPRKQNDAPAPYGYIYQLSQVIEATSPTLNVRHAPRRAEMYEYPLKPEDFNMDDVLYELRQKRHDHQEIELHGRHQNATMGELLRMHRDWTGSWKINVEGDTGSDFLFRTTPDWSTMLGQECRWITDDGKLLAKTGWDDATPNICLELGLQRRMVDLIVSCWIAKLWPETVVSLRRET